MSIKLQMPKLVDVKARLTVIGVGGAGCNAVNNMIAAGLQGVEFVVANTDAQSLAGSSAEHRVQLGANLTEGLGAGSRPEIGEAAAEEAIEELRSHIAGSHMVFIAAGMGGGTGTGAATVIARAARELGILTVGVVCKPFQFEGARRMRIADAGVQSLRQYVDTLIVIPNQNLFRVANERTTFAEAFVLADQVLYSGVACIVELVLKEGLINLDFADVKTVLSGMGTAMMGTGEATGDRRAILAAEEAIANPLLDDVTLKGARGVLLSIVGGRDMTLYEVDEAASRVRQEVDPDANIIIGATFDDNLGDRIRVSIVASGMNRAGEPMNMPVAPAAKPAPFFPGAVPSPNAAAQMQRPPHVQSPQTYHAQNQPQVSMQPAPHAHVAPPVQDAVRFEGYQDRLSDALYQQAQAPTVPRRSPGDSGESWAGPGGVMIEDGLQNFPPLSGNALANTPPLPTSMTYTQTSGHTYDFQPAPPAEFDRSARRMPTVDDFPPHAQKIYRSSQSAYGDEMQENPKKQGFFERLTGRGRKSA